MIDSKLYHAAVEYAREKHKGQKRADGSDYLGHCLRVARGCESGHAAILAVLHDVLEDTPTSAGELREALGLDYHTMSELLCLCHKKGTSYESYIYDIIRNGTDAVKEVKLADLIDNVSTLYRVTDETRRTRLERKYENAWSILMDDRYFDKYTQRFWNAFKEGTNKPA